MTMLFLLVLAHVVPAFGVEGNKASGTTLTLVSTAAQEEQFEVAAHQNFVTWCKATQSKLQDRIAVQQEQLHEVTDAIASYGRTAGWLRDGTLKNMSGVDKSVHMMESQSQLWRSKQMKSLIEMKVQSDRKLIAAIDGASAWEQKSFDAHSNVWTQLHIKQGVRPVQLVQASESALEDSDSGLTPLAMLARRFEHTGTVQKTGEAVPTTKPEASLPKVTNAAMRALQPPPGLLQLPDTPVEKRAVTPLMALAGVNAMQVDNDDPTEPAPSSALTQLSTQFRAISDTEPAPPRLFSSVGQVASRDADEQLFGDSLESAAGFAKARPLGLLQKTNQEESLTRELAAEKTKLKDMTKLLAEKEEQLSAAEHAQKPGTKKVDAATPTTKSLPKKTDEPSNKPQKEAAAVVKNTKKPTSTPPVTKTAQATVPASKATKKVAFVQTTVKEKQNLKSSPAAKHTPSQKEVILTKISKTTVRPHKPAKKFLDTQKEKKPPHSPAAAGTAPAHMVAKTTAGPVKKKPVGKMAHTLVSKVAKKHAVKAVNKVAETPATKMANKHVVKAATKPAVKVVKKPLVKVANKPSAKIAQKHVVEIAKKPAAKVAKVTKKIAAKMVNEPVAKVAKKLESKIAKKPEAKTPKKPMAKMAEKAAAKVLNKLTTKTNQEHSHAKAKVSSPHHSKKTSALQVKVSHKKSDEEEMQSFIDDVSNLVSKPIEMDEAPKAQAPSPQKKVTTAAGMALSSDLASLMGLSQDSPAPAPVASLAGISFLQVAEEAASKVDSRAELAASALAADLGQCRLVTVVQQQSIQASVKMLTAMKDQVEAQRLTWNCADGAAAVRKQEMRQLAEKGTQLLEAEHTTLQSLLADLRNFESSSAQTKAELVGYLEQTLAHTYEAAQADLQAATHSAFLQEAQAASTVTSFREELRTDAEKARNMAASLIQDGSVDTRLRDDLEKRQVAKEEQLSKARAVLAKMTGEALASQQAAAREHGCSEAARAVGLIAALKRALGILHGA